MKLHYITAFIGCTSLLASFLAPVEVAPVTYVLGIGLMVFSGILVTIENYEKDVIDRDRRRF